MKVRILGASGGIGVGRYTTSILVDDDILIDSGDGVGTLTLERMSSIRHLFVTHSHLDHLCHLPLLVDGLFEQLAEAEESLVIYGQPQTLRAIKKHIFNGVIWPDFGQLPTADKPVITFKKVAPGEVVELDKRKVEMIEVDHIVPAVGYLVSAGGDCFAFSGDTGKTERFWSRLNEIDKLSLLVVEAAYPNEMSELAGLAKHYCPITLAEDLQGLRHNPDIYITHLKPGMEEKVCLQLEELSPGRRIHRLYGGEFFDIGADTDH